MTDFADFGFRWNGTPREGDHADMHNRLADGLMAIRDVMADWFDNDGTVAVTYSNNWGPNPSLITSRMGPYVVMHGRLGKTTNASYPQRIGRITNAADRPVRAMIVPALVSLDTVPTSGGYVVSPTADVEIGTDGYIDLTDISTIGSPTLDWNWVNFAHVMYEAVGP